VSIEAGGIEDNPRKKETRRKRAREGEREGKRNCYIKTTEKKSNVLLGAIIVIVINNIFSLLRSLPLLYCL
jgi:hypothetical protein